MDSPARAKADSGAVISEEQAQDWAAKAAKAGQPRLRILTGDRTTGKLHLGHYVGSLKHRVKYQGLYDTYILMADVQALTTHYDHPEILKQSVWEVALDYMAVGIEPYTGGPDDGTKAKIVVQSMIPSIAELTVFYGLLVPVRSLIDNPTTKAEAEQHGFGMDYQPESTQDYKSIDEIPVASEIDRGDIGHLTVQLPNEFPELNWKSLKLAQVIAAVDALREDNDPSVQEELKKQDAHTRYYRAVLLSPYLQRCVRDALLRSQRQRGFTSMTYGFLGYPVSQAADITFVGAHLVPVGPDQVPLIELCREVVHRFNSQYGGTQLTTPFALLGVREALQGLDGNAKMSKSLGNAIYLSETDEEIWAKVKVAPTDPQRMRRTDPGRPEVCNIFSYHKVFNGEKEPAIDEAALGVPSVEETAELCRTAGIGCVDCKKNLCAKLKAILDPMRERRAQWEARPDDLMDVLKAGTARANEEGEKTLAAVKSAMHMDYFG